MRTPGTAVLTVALLAASCCGSAAAQEAHVVLRVNCGSGQDYVDTDGNAWLADRLLFDGAPWGATGGGRALREGLTIEGTPAPGVYLTERFGLHAYTFHVPDGSYALRLHFAETYDGAAQPGARVFSVSVNDVPALTSFDPFVAAGGFATPVVRCVDGVTVAGGTLQVRFAAEVQNPELNGVEVIALGLADADTAALAGTLRARLVGAGDPEAPPTILGDLRAVPRWVGQMGAVEGCLKFLGAKVSPAWLYGGTGVAFARTAPRGWLPDDLTPLSRNVGYVQQTVTAMLGRDLAESRDQAWQMVRKAIDEGAPCYAYDVEPGEHCVVHGYDGTGYYYRVTGSNEQRGPVHYRALGLTGGTGAVRAAAVRLTEPADDAKTVADALRFALAEQQGAQPEPAPAAGTPGPGLYDRWVDYLQKGEADVGAILSGTQCLGECRRMAADFLEEADARLARPDLTPLFDRAAGHYRQVAQDLAEVAHVLPAAAGAEAMPPSADVPDFIREFLEAAGVDPDAPGARPGAGAAGAGTVRAAVAAIKRARAAEEAGLKALARLLEALEEPPQE
jgi:hypothetical protein